MFQANIGIANLLALAMEAEGTPLEEARSKIWMVDSRGLIVNNRPKGGVTGHKLDFAKDYKPIDSLEEVVKEIKPTALIGKCNCITFIPWGYHLGCDCLLFQTPMFRFSQIC